MLPETIQVLPGAGGGGGGGTKSAPLILNAAQGYSIVDTETDRTVRWPIKLPVTSATPTPRLRLRNRDDRSGAGGAGFTLFEGEVEMSGVWWGKAARDAQGELTGAFESAPTQVSGPFTMPANADPVSVPMTLPAVAQRGEDHILSIGYTCDEQSNTLGQGGGWWSTDSAHASAAAPPLTRTQQTPFSVWIEWDVPASTPLVGWVTDSLGVGSAATLPIYDAPARQHALRYEVWPVMWSHHGSSMTHWIYGDSYRWTKFGPVQCTSVVRCVGSNDDFDGATLAQMKERTGLLYPIMTMRTGTSRVYDATIMPRNGHQTDAPREAVRVAYNEWLHQRPYGTWGVFDFAKSVESVVGTVRADYIAPDLVHLRTVGYLKNVDAVPASLG